MRFDQQVARNCMLDPKLTPRRFDERDHLGGIEDAANLGQGDIRRRFFGGAQDDADVVAPCAVLEVVNAHAYTAEAVFLAAEERCHQLGMRRFLADLRPVLAIERDIEHLTELRLQRERFPDQLFASCIVIAGGHDSGWHVAFKQDFGGGESAHRRRRVACKEDGNRGFGWVRTFFSGGQTHSNQQRAPAFGPDARVTANTAKPAYLPSRCATPSRSSSNSFSVPVIFSRENASISRPSTRLYSPFSHVTGTP